MERVRRQTEGGDSTLDEDTNQSMKLHLGSLPFFMLDRHGMRPALQYRSRWTTYLVVARERSKDNPMQRMARPPELSLLTDVLLSSLSQQSRCRLLIGLHEA
uniref:Uncharacterized protein n=1 Tax=Grammatophora oceanica TaxID=210454 RepID=A0A6U5MTC7_9STRA|mmetsp:Transcript_40604/g.60207  ORF Transcript_40604/g.60207 Transcript_40604/m.60207 type:complete len:102 (+) Transcript_40604:738-1043(+)